MELELERLRAENRSLMQQLIARTALEPYVVNYKYAAGKTLLAQNAELRAENEKLKASANDAIEKQKANEIADARIIKQLRADLRTLAKILLDGAPVVAVLSGSSLKEVSRIFKENS